MGVLDSLKQCPGKKNSVSLTCPKFVEIGYLLT